MSLTFLHPLFLYLLPLAAAPLIFHLFFRVRKRPRPFPTLMFFRRVDPRLSARRKILEWLILLLRVLLIVFLLLALSKLVWFGAGSTGSVAMVIVIDNSGSMAARFKDGQTKLREAINAAQGLVASLKEKDSAALVLLAEDVNSLTDSPLTSDKEALRALLGRVRETEATGSAQRALERAMSLLEKSAATRQEIHLLTDLQANEWGKEAAPRHPRSGTVIIVHRFDTPESRVPNVALLGARLPDRKILAGRRLPVVVEASNSGTAEARGRVHWVDDQGHRGSVETALPPRAEQEISLLLEAQAPGLHWLEVWYEGDDFTADNRACLAFQCLEKRPVAFAGAVEEFGLLPAALAPVEDGKFSGLKPEFVELPEFGPSLRDRSPVCAVVPWEAFNSRALDVGALRLWIEAGGNLLVLPATSGAGVAVGPPAWLGAAPEAPADAGAGLSLMAFKPAAPVFRELRGARGEIMLRGLKAFKFSVLRINEGTAALLGLEDGRVLLAQTGLGRGNIFLCGLAFDPAWSNLPLKGGSLALMQGLALAGEPDHAPVAFLEGGERVHTVFDPTESTEIKTLAGSVMNWKGPGANLPAFPRAGVYTVAAGKREQLVSVRSSAREGTSPCLPAANVPALGSLKHVVKSGATAGTVAAEARKLQASLDLFLPFLLLALACLAAEGWLANQPPLKPPQAEGDREPLAPPVAAVGANR